MNRFLSTIKRWVDMVGGKSVFHKTQAAGKYYEKGNIKGYYSDLVHKVEGVSLLDENGIPLNQTNRGEVVYFPISIFQYGLGAYDLYIETKDSKYINIFWGVVDWTINNQDNNGLWNTFGWQTPAIPYSAMAQSEGASILCRAYILKKEEQYLLSAQKAVFQMIKPIEGGGCSKVNNEYITFEEHAGINTVLNGMIFSIWGLYEVTLLSNEPELVEALDNSIQTLEELLPRYDRGYWSNYDLDRRIASPFYHNLHIEQLKVMYVLFEREVFKETYERWEKYQKSFIKSKIAFITKSFQKIGSISQDIVLVK